MPTSQIADRIAGAVTVRGVPFDLRDLLQGVLITGAPGCGKTTTLLNPLVAALADRGRSLDRPAVIYFAAKGAGHSDFVSRLSTARRRDVVVVGAAPEACRLELFPAAWWSADRVGAQASVEYVLELSRHIAGTSDRVGPYKAYWDGIWLRVLRTLAGLIVPEPCGDQMVGQAAHAPSLLVRLLSRCRMLSDYLLRCGVESAAKSGIAADGAASNPPPKPEEIGDWVNWIGSLEQPSEVAESLRRFLVGLAASGATVAAPDSSPPTPVLTDLQKLGMVVEEGSRERLRDLVRWLAGSRENVLHGVLGDLSSIRGLFEGVAGIELGDSGNDTISIEDAVHRGLILVIDLPVAGSGGGSRSAMVAAQLATFATLLARTGLRRDSGLRMNATRPVVLALDECHTICSRGRDSGLGRFLSQAREFGVITVAATQNLRLIAEALEDWSSVQALLGVIGTHAYGRNSEPLTLDSAVAHCPTLPQPPGAPRPMVLGFDDVAEDFRESLCDDPEAGSVPSMHSHIRDLEFGEFLVRTPSRGVHRVTARSLRIAPGDGSPNAV